MAVRIRLARKGRKKKAMYNIVVADSRSPRDGKFIDKLGNYSPIDSSYDLDGERSLVWLERGAIPSDTVRFLLSKSGVLFRKHLQIGVRKGAISQELADKRYSEWYESKKKETTKKA